MKQPYSWLKVLGSVGWDRKGSPESNLHVCGEDDMNRAIYNMKEKHAKEGGSKHRKRKQRTLRKKA